MRWHLRLDAELTPVERELLEAGRILAERCEDTIEACGERAPSDEHCPIDCPCCGPEQEALLRWGCAVWRWRRVAGGTQCPECDGAREVVYRIGLPGSLETRVDTCDVCGGQGRVP